MHFLTYKHTANGEMTGTPPLCWKCREPAIHAVQFPTMAGEPVICEACLLALLLGRHLQKLPAWWTA